MKLLCLFLLVSCVEAKPSMQLDPSLPRYHACNYYIQAGWEVDTKKCAEHLANPKYKIGSTLKVINNRHDPNCRFSVKYPFWSPNTNSPVYRGDLICGEYRRETDMEESELK